MEIAYQTLGISPSASLVTIRQKYKKLAKELHPDKGGDEAVFAKIQQSYCDILKAYTDSRTDKDHNTLKSSYSNQSKDVGSRMPTTNNRSEVSENQMFNNVFEEYRTPSYTDSGYGDIMTKSSNIREEISIQKTIKKFSIDKFNKTFDNIKPENCKHIIKKSQVDPYHEPKTLNFTTLGVEHLEDFSGTNDDNKSLHYTDYNEAHSTSKLVHPKHLKPKKKGTDSLEKIIKTRETVIEEFTDEELARHTRHLNSFKKKEAQRLHNLQKQDDLISMNFSKAHKLIQEHIEYNIIK